MSLRGKVTYFISILANRHNDIMRARNFTAKRYFENAFSHVLNKCRNYACVLLLIVDVQSTLSKTDTIGTGYEEKHILFKITQLLY